jgi:methylated-DNA-[protein]-cysteine S-methyltransferase
MTTESSHKQYDAVIPTPLGNVRLGLRFADTRLAGIDFLDQSMPLSIPESVPQQDVIEQLQDYFAEPARGFEVELALEGTPFQRRLWQALRRIPAGQTLTYGELARQLGSSARAVGGACRRNRIPVVIPCHRVVAKSGPGGFMGQTRGAAMTLKQWLLEHERQVHEA